MSMLHSFKDLYEMGKKIPQHKYLSHSCKPNLLQFQNGGMELDASFSSSFCTELDAQMLVAMETMEKQPRSQKSLPKGMDVY